VTAVDFGETAMKNLTITSRPSVATAEEEDWFPEHHEASICLVHGSDESDVDGGGGKKSEETLRDMVLTANEYFARGGGGGGGESGNWWE
jgi:hypothetical protein